VTGFSIVWPVEIISGSSLCLGVVRESMSRLVAFLTMEATCVFQ